MAEHDEYGKKQLDHEMNKFKRVATPAMGALGALTGGIDNPQNRLLGAGFGGVLGLGAGYLGTTAGEKAGKFVSGKTNITPDRVIEERNRKGRERFKKEKNRRYK